MVIDGSPTRTQTRLCTDRQTYTDADRQTDRQTDTDRQADRQTDRQTDTNTHTHTHTHTHTRTDAFVAAQPQQCSLSTAQPSASAQANMDLLFEKTRGRALPLLPALATSDVGALIMHG